MLVVEENYANGVPQTAVRGFAPTGAGWHWTAGGPGRAGWEGSLAHLISTRYTVNASYHAGLWHEHAADGACRTVVQWVVPTSSAAHSIAPSQVFQLNANKDRATQDARFAEVRRILGAKASDPNAACIAVAYAGMPLGLEKDLACPVFRADVQELAWAVIAETTVIDRPHFGHGWIQPISRYEMDVATDFIGMLYGVPATPQEDSMPTNWTGTKFQQPKVVKLRAGSPIYADEFASVELGKLTGDTDFYFPGYTLVQPGAAAMHLVSRLDQQNDPAWVYQEALIPESEIPFRRYTLDGGDCSDEVAVAEQAVTAHVDQEWRDWLATAPAAPGGTS